MDLPDVAAVVAQVHIQGNRICQKIKYLNKLSDCIRLRV